MQISPVSVAAQAAGTVSQSASKDTQTANSTASAPAPQAASDLHVEQSGTSNPDRDAQGQGDGMGDPGQRPSSDEKSTEEQRTIAKAAPLLPGEEPGQLDIFG